MSDQDFIEQFVAGRLPPEGFDHRAHLRAACLLLGGRPFLQACLAMREGVRAIALKAGKPELYHETITVAFMAVVAERMATCELAWRELLAAHPDLFDRELLCGYYSRARLASPAARRAFILPDRVPCPA